MKTLRLLTVLAILLLAAAPGFTVPHAAQASQRFIPDSPDALTITSVEQDAGDLRQLTIHGTDFVDTPTVDLDGTALLNVVFVDATMLRATVPDDVPSEMHTLRVVNPDAQAATLTKQFYFDPPPSISNVTQSPDNLRQLTITGQYFIATPTVRLGGTLLENIQFVNAQRLSATVPSGIPDGNYDLQVVNPDGQGAVLNKTFTFTPAPVIIQVSQQPTNLRILNITGRNFVSTPAVFFDQTPLENIQFVDAQNLMATIPASVTSGQYTLKVVNPDGQPGSWIFNYTQPALAPVVTRVTQRTSNLRLLAINGENFVYTPTVYLDQTPLLNVSFPFTSTASLRATVPPEVPNGVYTLRVVNPDGQEGTFTKTFNFDQAGPEISAVIQTPGNPRLLTIKGANFFNTTDIYLNDTVLTSSTMVDASTMTATVPPSIPSGVYTIKVVNPDLQEATLADQHLIFELPPEISKVTQSQSDPRLLTIQGSNFVPTSAVYLGQTALQGVLWGGSTSLSARIPAGIESGTYTLRVVNPDGQEDTLEQNLTFDWKAYLPMAMGSISP